MRRRYQCSAAERLPPPSPSLGARDLQCHPIHYNFLKEGGEWYLCVNQGRECHQEVVGASTQIAVDLGSGKSIY